MSSVFEMSYIGPALIRFNFSAEERAEFYKQLSSFVRKGVSIKKAVTLMEEKYAANKKLSYLHYIAKTIKKAIEESKNVSSALKGFVPDDEIFILLSGEQADDDKTRILSFDNAAASAIDKMTLKGIVVKALSYPAILLIASIGLIFFIGTFLMPELEKNFPLQNWPSIAKDLYSFSTYFSENFFILVSIIGATIFVFSKSLSSWAGSTRLKLDNYFPYSMYREVQSVGVLMSIANLVASGKKFTEAINLIKENASDHLRTYMEKIISVSKEGRSTGEALEESNLFNTKVGTQIAIYYEAGNFEGSLPDLSKITMKIVQRRLSNISSLIIAASLLSILGLILWTVFSVMDISGSIV